MCCKTVSDGKSILVPADLYGDMVEFVLDTGAAVTVLSSYVYNSISADVRPVLKKPDHHLKLEVANDSLLEIEGIASFQIKIDKYYYFCDMYVAPIRENGLLGLDFLYAQNYSLSAEKGPKLNGKKVHTVIQTVPLRAVHVSVKYETVIPANSQCVFECCTYEGC